MFYVPSFCVPDADYALWTSLMLGLLIPKNNFFICDSMKGFICAVVG
ncbi:hypothetical protein ACPOL_3817 [Acidisarcina polymorpha]|uniref:Uncharacterized protein n=1 Tax=Acidisarcina polymorpha TaxID=2211140 RepID=A0A2Z5G3J3_9BACT|nr:hypothetical protein ACPOL_3817 [Acidisarcina polymorpha]